MTALHFAATHNDVHILNYTIEHMDSKSVDILNEEGWSPLHLAAFMGAMDSSSLLIENKADLRLKNA